MFIKGDKIRVKRPKYGYYDVDYEEYIGKEFSICDDGVFDEVEEQFLYALDIPESDQINKLFSENYLELVNIEIANRIMFIKDNKIHQVANVEQATYRDNTLWLKKRDGCWIKEEGVTDNIIYEAEDIYIRKGLSDKAIERRFNLNQ